MQVPTPGSQLCPLQRFLLRVSLRICTVWGSVHAAGALPTLGECHQQKSWHVKTRCHQPPA